MGDTSIEWTRNADGTKGKTWNPVRGCSLKSKGCTNCYAMRMAHRFGGAGQPYEGLTKLGPNGPVWTGKVRCVPELLGEPLKWRKPSFVFVNSMSDLFHEGVPDEFIDQVFAVMAAAKKHTFQILTKRPARMVLYFAERTLGDAYTNVLRMDDTEPAYSSSPLDYVRGLLRVLDSWEVRDRQSSDYLPKTWPLPNVWLGVSTEDQAAADERIPHLLKTPAAVRFLSVEPMLGPTDLGLWRVEIPRHREHWPVERFHNFWVIAGGESGPGARPVHPDWVRSVRDQCVAAGVPFFFKQWGEYAPLGATSGLDPDHFYPGRGHRVSVHSGVPMDEPTSMFRVGKKAAGRILDGRTWDEVPAGRGQAVAT